MADATPGASGRTLIRGARVVFPEETRPANILLGGGVILDADASSNARAHEVVDARGLALMPGVIDDQVHFREPGLTHKEDIRTGSMAAAAGGVTSFLEMPNTFPATTSRRRLLEKLQIAKRSSLVNYGFFIGATPDNLNELLRARRTPGIKIFMGSSTGNLLVEDEEALEAIFACGSLPIATHCEDERTVARNLARLKARGRRLEASDHSRIRDARAALRATRRAVRLALRHRRRLHVLHVSTKDEVPLLERHGNVVTGEACPHHLFFDVRDYDRLGTLVQMNPSLKSMSDRRALWQALRQGSLQVVATDHAPHTLEEKQKPYPDSPSGIPAVQLSLPLMLDQAHLGRCALPEIARWMCEAPARVWDIAGKGRIQEGYDADLVLIDLALARRVRNRDQLSKCGWSPWRGAVLTGWPIRTWVAGRTVFQSGRVASKPLGSELRFDPGLGGYWS